MEIEQYIKHFEERLAPLPIQYPITYNAPLDRANRSGSIAASNVAKKPTVSVIEVTLRWLHGPAGPVDHVCRLSRTEPTLSKLYREATNVLGKSNDSDVILVHDGLVLQRDQQAQSQIEKVVSKALPIYIFDRNQAQSTIDKVLSNGSTFPAKLGDAFKTDLQALLARHGLDTDQSAKASSWFVDNYLRHI